MLDTPGTWRKSSYSHANGQCVECASAAGWRKSSHSYSDGHCTEVAELPHGMIGVRDSKDPDGPVLAFGWSPWREFVRKIKMGWRPGS